MSTFGAHLKLLLAMKTINLKALLLGAVVLLTPIFLQAQYGFYHGQQLDHTYLTVENITDDDLSNNGLGYIISTTTFESPSVAPLNGEITRTDDNGVLQWVNQYITTQGPATHRFNHIEKYNFNGQLEYLVVGSLVDGTTTTLLAAIIDDNGTVLASKELTSTSHNNLLGIKGIVTSDQEFAIVALESDGFTATDDKNIVVIKLDQNLALQQSITVSSANVTNDYDMATDILEAQNGDRFFIIGTSNKNGNPSRACSFAALIDFSSSSVVWSHNYSTALGYHWDAAADAYFDGDQLYVLANSSIVHYYNVVQLEGTTGVVNNEIQFSDVTYGNDFNHYGYEIKRSVLGEDGGLVISGWKSLYSSDAVQPFLMEFNPNDASINWHWKYNSINNNQLSLNENNWLNLTAGGQFPYYYNNMMTYRPDRRGYGMLSAFEEGNDMVLLWYKTDMQGNVSEDCGQDSVHADSIVWTFHYNNDIKKVTDNTQEGMEEFLRETPIAYDESRCEWEFNKNGVINSTQDAIGSIYKVYPNPATNSLFVSGDNIAYISVTDMFGREVLREEAGTQTQYSINVSGVKAGIYLVNIATTNGGLVTQKVTIIK